MKTPLAAALIALILSGCGEYKPPVIKSSKEIGEAEQQLTIEQGNYITLKTVTLDGNEYYMFKTTHGYWGLCPKLPAKVRTEGKR